MKSASSGPSPAPAAEGKPKAANGSAKSVNRFNIARRIVEAELSKENAQIDCFNLFWKELFNAKKSYGLPTSLTEEEVLLLNQMYYMYIVSKHCPWQLEYPYSLSEGISHSEFDTSTKYCLSALAEEFRSIGCEGLVTQLEIFFKSQEPTLSHAVGLLSALLSPEFLKQDLAKMEEYAANDASFAVVLAMSYDFRKSVNPEYGKLSVKHYLQAVNKFESPIAAMQLGSKYLRGDGVKQNNVLAFRWYSGAAALNNPVAQHKMGYFYDEGLEGACEVDVCEAIRWYSLAGELMPDSMHNVAKMFEDGRHGPNLKFEPKIRQAQELYSIAAARGFTFSQVNLGRLFLLGEDSIPHDRDAGKHLLTMAAESGDCDAQLVVGMIHATPAFECYDLALSEYWLKQSLAGGKEAAEKSLQRVQQQMQNLNIPSLTGPVPGFSGTAEAAKQRGDDFKNHGLLEAAAIEYSKAHELDYSELSYYIDSMETLCELEIYEELIIGGAVVLSSINSDGVNVFDSDITRNVFSAILCERSIETITASRPSTKIKTNNIINKIRAVVAAVHTSTPKADSSLKEILPEEDEASTRRKALMCRFYDTLAKCLVVVNCDYFLSIDFMNVTFLRAHKEALIARFLQGILDDGPHALMSMSMVLRLCMNDFDSVKIVVEQGGLVLLLSIVQMFHVPIDSSDSSGSFALNGLKRALSVHTEKQNATVPKMQSDRLFFGLYALANMICCRKHARLLLACDGLDVLVHFCCSSVAYPGKNEDLNVIIQIFGRVIAFADKAIWTQLRTSGIEYAFACVFLVALNDIERNIIDKSSCKDGKTVELFKDSKKSAGDGKVSNSTEHRKSPAEAPRRLQKELLGVAVSYPPLQVRSQLAPEIHFLEQEDCYFLLTQLLATLGLILKVSPDEFTVTMADSDLMPILQTVFRLLILTAEMRSACAYCLCKLLYAKDPEAAKIIQDGLCENSLPNIFDDTMGTTTTDPKSFMQFSHQISFVGTWAHDDYGDDATELKSSGDAGKQILKGNRVYKKSKNVNSRRATKRKHRIIR